MGPKPKKKDKKGKSKSTSSEAENPQSSKESTSWSEKDETALIDYLLDHRAEGDGNGHFKISTFNAAASVVEKLRTEGAEKTGQVCKNKWFRIKSTAEVCRKLKENDGTSGFAWSEERGADIGLENEHVWVAYVKQNPAAKPFKTKGWAHYNKVVQLLPSKAKGTNVFVVSQAAVPDPSHAPDSSSSSGSSEPDKSSSDSHAEIEDNGNAHDEGEGNALDEDDHSSDEHPGSYSPPPLPPAPPVTAPAVSRKRPSDVLTTPVRSSAPASSSRSAPRLTAMSHAVDNIGRAITVAFGPREANTEGLESSPKRRKIAMELAEKQEEGDLSDNELAGLMELLRKDTSAADAYSSMSQSGLRRAWIRKALYQNEDL